MSVMPVETGIQGWQGGASPSYKICSYKSDHARLPSSINLIFHTRFHFFSAYSLPMALSIDS